MRAPDPNKLDDDDINLIESIRTVMRQRPRHTVNGGGPITLERGDYERLLRMRDAGTLEGFGDSDEADPIASVRLDGFVIQRQIRPTTL